MCTHPPAIHTADPRLHIKAQQQHLVSTLVGLIHKNDESCYRDEVSQLTTWCEDNNLTLNMDKTKEIIDDFRRAHTQHPPLVINGSFGFLE